MMSKRLLTALVAGSLVFGNFVTYAEEMQGAPISEESTQTDLPADAVTEAEVPTEESTELESSAEEVTEAELTTEESTEVQPSTEESTEIQPSTEEVTEAELTTEESAEDDLQTEDLGVSASFKDINADEVFLMQVESGTCTLVANVNMLRRNAIIHGNENWSEITLEAAKPELWISGTGMKWDYEYQGVSVKRVNVEQIEPENKAQLFQNLLKNHPEGVVIHDYDKNFHAVLLTDYTDGVFYCAETVESFGTGRIPLEDSLVSDIEGVDQYWYVSEAGQLDDGIVYANPTGIVTLKADHESYIAGIGTMSAADKARIEYSWYASLDGGETYECISDWTKGYEWINWTPESWGQYKIIGKTRVDGKPESVEEVSAEFEYHPAIMGKCQMPYTGEGGGYLIGFETYDNPDQKYTYEVLILDCTLLAQDKPAWIYSTGRCHVESGNAFWTVWQPIYGYYWTLFRLYDEEGNLLDEQCYGFENI